VADLNLLQTFDRLGVNSSPSDQHSYDSAERRTSMTVNGQTQVSYTRDNANRLTGIAQGSSSVALNYDAANRRTSMTLPNGVAVAYTYDSDTRVTGARGAWRTVLVLP